MGVQAEAVFFEGVEDVVGVAVEGEDHLLEGEEGLCIEISVAVFEHVI